MAIPPELTAFQGEAAFRDRFIIPLLYRLGFSVVVEYHGQREFGRDIIFGEIDRLGHVVYYALQVKYLPVIHQTESHGLVADAKESFAHDFHHPQKQTKERVCRFYVANAGSIATNARDNFFAILEQSIASNSVLLDGSALLSLTRSTPKRIHLDNTPADGSTAFGGNDRDAGTPDHLKVRRSLSARPSGVLKFGVHRESCHRFHRCAVSHGGFPTSAGELRDWETGGACSMRRIS